MPNNYKAEARIDQILEAKEVTFDEYNQMLSPDNNCRQNPECTIQIYQKMQGTLTNGEQINTQIQIINGDQPSPGHNQYKIGDQVIVEPNFTPNSTQDTNSIHDTNSQPTYYISDYVRRQELFVLFAIFLIIIFAVTKFKGIKAIIGMFYSFLIIFKITIPFIINGHNPFLAAILSIFLILPPTFYFSHGFSRKSNAAMIGTAISLFLTVVIAYLAVIGTKLTGFSSEESNFIISLMGSAIDIRSLLIAGIMISALGTLNDVTVSQAAVVEQLKQADSNLSLSQVYKAAMKVGQDHIVSMIDTLILVYAGGSLPLLILLSDGAQPLSQALNYEMIAVEIVKMIVGSIGLILAVPITTFTAALFFEEN